MALNKYYGAHYKGNDIDGKAYRIGQGSGCPIALFLALAAEQKDLVARYFNLFTHSTEAKKLQDKLCSTSGLKTPFHITQETVNQFDGLLLQGEVKNEVPSIIELSALSNKEKSSSLADDFFEKQKKSINEYTDIDKAPLLDLHVYARQFAQLLRMKTQAFSSGSEGTIMACPMSYIHFLNRREFTEVYKTLDKALEHIIKDVARVLKLRGFDVNDYDYTVSLPHFEPIEFEVEAVW